MVLGLVLLLFGLGAVGFVEEQRLQRDQDAQDAAMKELVFLKGLATEFLQQGDYEDIQSLLQDWGQRQEDTVELQLEASSGFRVGHYLRPQTAQLSRHLTTDIQYGYQGEAILSLTKDLDGIQRQQLKLLTQIISAYILVVAMGIYLTFSAQRRQREAIRFARLNRQLSQANRELGQEMERRSEAEQALRKERDEITRLAFHDTLTGLPNRSLLMDRLQTSLQRAGRDKHIDALLFLDLDQFKHINDSLGHRVGDGLLRQVAARLSAQLRQVDTVARLGGDEFVVLLSSLHVQPGAATIRAGALAEKIRMALTEPYQVDGHVLHSSPSIGIALLPLDADNVEDALKHADQAMYRAKAEGRNTIQFYLPEMQARAKARLSLESDLRRALDNGELSLHYQPLLDIQQHGIVGAEALLRWQHPVHGLMLPDAFISIAEESGLILPIGEWVLKNTCWQISTWQQSGLPVMPVSVNLSAAQFRHKGLPEHIEQLLRDLNLPAGSLELELTESLLLENMPVVTQTLERLSATGVQLSVDDFGTGYSSLSYLRRFKLHKLKIDRSFIDQVPTDPDDATITETVIQMAHNLKLLTVAEGVETREQLDFLVAKGCDQAQGFLFSEALEAEEFEKLVRSGVSFPVPTP